MKNIIICWYGSFNNTGTLGDLYAVISLVNNLKNKYNISCITNKKYKEISCNQINLNEINIKKFDLLIFCCGPIMKNHFQLNNLFNKFKNIKYKFGISVSILDYNPFDFVLARQGQNQKYEDIAILSHNLVKNKIINYNKIKIGLVLRGIQKEYGVKNCLTNKVNNVLNNFFDLLKINKIEYEKIIIDNHLFYSKLEPQEILNQYKKCNLIITTRFHGSIISLLNNIPFISIDQIKNGGKLIEMLEGYKYLYKINDINEKDLLKDLYNIIYDKNINNYLEEYYYNKYNKAKNTISTLLDFLNNQK